MPQRCVWLNTFPSRGVLYDACGNSPYAFFCYRRYRAIKPTNSKDLPINEEITASEVRVIGPDNEQVGIMKIDDAIGGAI